ncbi:hypothetical protein QSU92_12610 [Microbacterium sp. ET2]|uniref:hypothetical protein n=1 Tax=Microbacterium albipurpureum TaxID=3050384 RepID=UPI00259CD02B|nr:hypothetical protein [Microbacterium sp. ET2 (Ac-2212)]WJL94804.1 hypothetical protein QSU92_12610 [Microbacterium sp. ET2 (Ac-2212)]
MSSDSPVSPPATRRFRAWPLWALAAGVAGTVGSIVTDLRPDGELAAVAEGREYTVTPADMAGLDPLLGRVGYLAGLTAIIALLIFVAFWRRHIDAMVPRSTGARLVSGGLIAAAGALTLGYGWRGALANYLGPESGMYGEQGLFVYYMLTDFGAYISWTAAIAAALGVAWMAFFERNLSRVLGVFSAVFGVGTLGAILVTGVPGLPGVFMPFWLAVTGVWLAVGRSRALAASYRPSAAAAMAQ